MIIPTVQRVTALPSTSDNWFGNEFFDDMRILMDAADPKKSELEARFLIDKLHLRRGQSFLDCPCGTGRISLPLARQGIRVTGVDLTPSYLSALQGKAAREQLSITVGHGDMRRIKFVNVFDAAANLGSSFGYFDKREDDYRTLKNLFNALKPGGRLALHTSNRDWILKEFESTGFDELNGSYILHKRKFDYRTSVLHIIWTFITDNRKRVYNVRFRLYSFHEMLSLFARAGFTDVEGFGSIKADPIDRNQRMMWLFARKPK